MRGRTENRRLEVSASRLNFRFSRRGAWFRWHSPDRAPLLRNLRFGPDRANSSISLSPPQGGRWASRLRFAPASPQRGEDGPQDQMRGGAKRKAARESIGGFIEVLCPPAFGCAASSSAPSGHLLPAGEKRETAICAPFPEKRGMSLRKSRAKSNPDMFFRPRPFPRAYPDARPALGYT